MNRKEAIEMWVIPALKNTWNEKKCDEILKALEQEPCADAISRQAALNFLKPTGLKFYDFINDARNKIKDLPLVTPAQKIGYWVIVNEQAGVYKCSVCNELSCCSSFYCHNCGAKMQEVEE